MIGCLVKWIHDHEPTNLCVILRKITEDKELMGALEDNPLFLCYDFITKEEFYALEDELHFIN
jgi:hypothetical protein